MPPETENLFNQLDRLGKDYGWAARIILIGFKASGLYAHNNHMRPIKAFVRETIYQELKPEEKPKFFTVVASLLQNKDAISLLTTNANRAHSPYSAPSLTEADVIKDIQIILNQLTDYEHDRTALLTLFRQTPPERYISQLQTSSPTVPPDSPETT